MWVSAPPGWGAGWVGGGGTQMLTGHGLASLCLSSVDLIASSPQGLRGLVGWVHRHAAGCGALPSLQRTLSSEYCGVIRAMWGCDQGHDYTMDADSSCGALLLDSALGVKWTWDKDSAPRLPQHRGFNPTGAAPQSSQGKAAAAGAETETLPSMDKAGFLQMVTQWGRGRAPRLSQASPRVGPQVGGSSGLFDQYSWS